MLPNLENDYSVRSELHCSVCKGPSRKLLTALKRWGSRWEEGTLRSAGEV